MLNDLTRFMWLDSEGNIAGPLHETIKSAVNYRVNWKQAAAKTYAKQYGNGRPPVTLKKVIVKHEFLDDVETRTLSTILGLDDEEDRNAE